MLTVGALLLGAVACSSSSSKKAATSSTATPTTALTSQGRALCAPFTKFVALTKQKATTVSDFRAGAPELKAMATALSTDPPPELASSAKTSASALNDIGAKLSSVTTAAQAQAAVAVLIFGTDSTAFKPIAAWAVTNCPKS
jgi:hypothetical protein